MENKQELGFIESTTKESPIEISKANQLIENHFNAITDFSGQTLPIKLQTKDNEPIKGFYFPKDELLAALGSEGVGIYLAFGLHDGKMDPNEKGSTIILYGVSSVSGELSTIEEYGRIFDYSKPCPKKCPKQELLP